MSNCLTILDNNYTTLKTISDTARAKVQTADIPKDVTIIPNWVVNNTIQTALVIKQKAYNSNK